MEGTNYQIAIDKGWQDVKAKDPLEIASRLCVSYCADKRRFTVTFFGEAYVLDCDAQTILRQSDASAPNVTASILILNYLSFSDSAVRPEGHWVSLKEIPNGGAIFYPAFLTHTIKMLIDTFGHQSQKLLQAGQMLGGKPAAMGSASVKFEAFPEVPLCIVVWEGDEEVHANATVLFDPSAAALLHIESVIGVGMYATEQLKSLAAAL